MRGAGARVGIREEQKQATRRRVLDASRDLFNEAGYEATTIRAIAQRAEVSVGSVFTTFSSKADILSQVMEDRLEALYAELERVIPLLRGSTADRVRSIYALHCDFEMRRPNLYLAHLAAAFNPDLEPHVAPAGRNNRLSQAVLEVLASGIGRGDVAADADLELALHLLHGAYLWNFPRVAAGKATCDDVIAGMDRQIGLIFQGIRP